MRMIQVSVAVLVSVLVLLYGLVLADFFTATTKSVPGIVIQRMIKPEVRESGITPEGYQYTSQYPAEWVVIVVCQGNVVSCETKIDTWEHVARSETQPVRVTTGGLFGIVWSRIAE